jgi:hypothetical protein
MDYYLPSTDNVSAAAKSNISLTKQSNSISSDLTTIESKQTKRDGTSGIDLHSFVYAQTFMELGVIF